MDLSVREKVAELKREGFCVLEGLFSASLIEASREAFWPILTSYLLIITGPCFRKCLT